MGLVYTAVMFVQAKFRLKLPLLLLKRGIFICLCLLSPCFCFYAVNDHAMFGFILPSVFLERGIFIGVYVFFHRPFNYSGGNDPAMFGLILPLVFLTARPWAERGSCFTRDLLFFFLSVTRPEPPLGQIVFGALKSRNL